LGKGPLAGAATPRERERQIAPKKARHFSLKITLILPLPTIRISFPGGRTLNAIWQIRNGIQTLGVVTRPIHNLLNIVLFFIR
jgi:hypothetical protein